MVSMGRFLPARALAAQMLLWAPLCGYAPAMAAVGRSACLAPFPAPKGPMLLTRELHRSLFDGKELVVTRHYRITFVPTRHGFEISGTLEKSEALAPPRLEALARMERERADTLLFPIVLDKAGRIVAPDDQSASGVAPSEKPLAEALAQGLLNGAGLPSMQQGQARGFVESLFAAQGPAISPWPEWLFRPGDQPQMASEKLDLGEGKSGKVTISLTPSAVEPCGVMRRVERTVETEVGQQRRRTQEIWMLEAP